MAEQERARPLLSAEACGLGDFADMEIGELIKLKRKEQRITQRVLASELGVAHSAVAQWELGVTLPTSANMAALKVILGIGGTVQSSAGSPYEGELVDDPDELAWLNFWRSLTRERKVMVTDLLRIGLPVRKAM